MSLLPEKYRSMDDSELQHRIAAVKRRFGSRLLILGHYYQCSEVIDFADHQGDSYALAKAGASSDAEWIVFCGVHFMAESSVILARPGQHVFLPDMDAGCPLADMASVEEVGDAWRVLDDMGIANDFLPITYINSSAALKAFTGRRCGCVCTSSSAASAFDWAIGKGKRIFFFPDENLGRNTAHAKGISDKEIAFWDPHDIEASAHRVKDMRVVVWKGFCHVHTYFTTGHIEAARAKYPGCKIVVHPECYPNVVGLSDASGSTSFLKKYAEDAAAGLTVVIGTEINLVARLAREHPEKTIVPLARSLCPNMFKVSLADLCFTLDNLGKVNEVFVPDDILRDARVALERMLQIGS